MSASALLLSWGQKSPLATALITEQQSYTWQDLNRIVKHYAITLHTQGLACGDVLTIVSKNQPELPLVYLACLQLGVVPAICSPQSMTLLKRKLHVLYTEIERPFIWIAKPEGVAFTGSEFETLNINSQIVHIPSLFGLDFNAAHPSDSDGEIVFSSPLPQALSSIIFTSGSSGTPKAVAHHERQHIASAQGLLAHFDFQRQDCWLLSLPMYHVSGLAIIWRWLVSGGCFKIGSGRLDEDIQGVTHASLVPTQLKRLLDSKQPLTLKRVLLGGSHIPHSLAQQAQQVGIDTWVGYGMTEAASTVTAKRLDDIATAGSLLPKRELNIVDQRIFIGGETLASGYYHQGQLTSLTCDGWFDSKDLGQWQLNELVVLGRADNQFISGGENIHCEEIEAVLNRHMAIRQAFVIPIGDPEFGFRPVAILDSDRLESDKDYRHFLSGKLDSFKYPIAYFLMPKIDQQGIKVSRKALSDWLLQSEWAQQRLQIGEAPSIPSSS